MMSVLKQGTPVGKFAEVVFLGGQGGSNTFWILLHESCELSPVYADQAIRRVAEGEVYMSLDVHTKWVISQDCDEPALVKKLEEAFVCSEQEQRCSPILSRRVAEGGLSRQRFPVAFN
jgi:hypothetical protein